jgi:hypothetical protein
MRTGWRRIRNVVITRESPGNHRYRPETSNITPSPAAISINRSPVLPTRNVPCIVSARLAMPVSPSTAPRTRAVTGSTKIVNGCVRRSTNTRVTAPSSPGS